MLLIQNILSHAVIIHSETIQCQTPHAFFLQTATVHTVAIMALEASPSEPSNNEMFSPKT